MIDEVERMAAEYSILAGQALKHRVNARLNRTMELPDLGVRVEWASVHIDVEPSDMHEAESRMRLRARARAEWEEKELSIAQAVMLRDLLREDPTLALAHLMLESPEKVTDHADAMMKLVAERVAAHAPGAAWVATAQLLENSFGKLPTDAKQFIVDRICRALAEFGADEEAQQISRVHRATSANSSQSEVNGSLGDSDAAVNSQE
ncbi:hypothetical protein AB0M72_22225 [Nocardiopsis dassonvillei]